VKIHRHQERREITMSDRQHLAVSEGRMREEMSNYPTGAAGGNVGGASNEG
jgi:hypothetical protein